MSTVFPNANLPFWKQVPLLPVLFFLVLGILIQDKLSILQSFRFSVFLLVISFIGSYFALRRKLKLGQKVKSFLGALWLVMLGMTLVFFSDPRNDPRWFGHDAHQAEAFKIRLTEEVQVKPKTYLLTTKVEAVLKDDKWHPTSGKLLVYVYKADSADSIRLGQALLIPNQLVRIKHNHNPFAFDYAKNRERNGYFFKTFLSKDEISLLGKPHPASILVRARSVLLKILNRYIPDEDTKQLTAATLLNERAGLDDFIQDAYSNTGITHIIAISGMHVNMLFYLLLYFMFWIRKRRHLWIKYVLALPLIWFYILLTGSPPSALRAAIMFSLIALSVGLDRPVNGINILAFTAFVMFCMQPLWIYHIGVQLSFLAVLSIFIFYQPIQRLVHFRNFVLDKVWKTIAVSLAVQILVFPLVIYYFHQFPIWFLPANFFAALFSLLLMGLALAILLFGLVQLSVLATFLGKLLISVTNTFHQIIVWMNAHSWDASQLLALDALDYWLLMAVIVFSALFFLKKLNWALMASLGMLALFFVNLWMQDLVAARQQTFIVYAYNNHSLLQLNQGKTAYLFSDSLMDARSERFVLRPAYLGYRIKHIKPMRLSMTQHLGSFRVQWLGATTDALTTDAVLVVSKYTSFEPDEWLAAKPRLIVIDNSLPRWKALKWAETLREMGAKVHNVREEGAWILNQK